MGAKNSKITNEQFTRIVSETFINSAKECKIDASNSFMIDVSDVGGDFELDGLDVSQKINLNLTCVQNDLNETTIKENIKDKLSSQIESIPFWENMPYQESYNKQVKELSDSVNINTIKNCVGNLKNDVSIKVDDVNRNVVIKNITVNQVMDVVSECIQSDTNTMKKLRDLNSTLESETSKATSYIWIIAGVLIFFILLKILGIFRSKKGD
jgi:hypothetical protein